MFGCFIFFYIFLCYIMSSFVKIVCKLTVLAQKKIVITFVFNNALLAYLEYFFVVTTSLGWNIYMLD